MPIKAIRLQIIKPYNEPNEEQLLTWDGLVQTLCNLRYAASRMANYVIQQNYMWEFFRQNHQVENKKYPNSKRTEKCYCYPALTRMFPDVAGQVVNQIEQSAKKVWSSRKAEVMRLHQSVPSFKLNFPIVCHRKSYSIKTTIVEGQHNYNNFKYIIQANLTSKVSGRTSYAFYIDAGEKSKKAILDRIISKEYRQGALQIVSDKKNKWYCIIPYEFAVETNSELDPQRIMGIDLGISKAIYWAFSDSLKRGWIDGHEIEEFRRRVQARRRSIQEQGKYCGDGRIGHGRKRRLLPIAILQDKEANFRDTINHRYSRRVIEEAVRNKCGVIQMEDLSGISELNRFLKNWTYFDLQTKIKAKATEVGIEVRIVDPKYTSQRCSQCGHIDRSNRLNQATFICGNCGYGLYHCFSCGKNQDTDGLCTNCGVPTKYTPVNADYNAAKNLATSGIDEIIAKELTEREREREGKKSAKVKRTRKPR